jgi:predicted transcriptional regulator
MSGNDLLRLSAQIVSAHAKHNSVSSADLTSVIQSVYQALKSADGSAVEELPPQSPAVPIKKSVFPGYIVCLEDGKKLKMLKRHLMAAYGMTPDEYRARWKLPSSYPMVAPDYSERRSNLAKEYSLGRATHGGFLVEEPVGEEPHIQKIAAGVRGRKARTKKAVDQQNLFVTEE